MKFTDFFIRRPVLAIVVNCLFVVFGLMSLQILTIREYPAVDIPKIIVTANYPNASAELVETTVTSTLEEALAGISGLDVMHSTSQQNISRVRLRMKPGTSMNQGLMQVRDALIRYRGRLPSEVKDPTVERGKDDDSDSRFMFLSLVSPSRTFAELTHFATLLLSNPLRSISGIVSVEVWGQPYQMDVMLNPQKMYTFGINASDVLEALKKNNITLPAGKFQEKVPATLDLSLSTEEDFANVFIKEKDNHPIFLRHVADILLKANTKFCVRINGQPGVMLALQKESDANPLEISKEVRKKISALREQLPDGMALNIEMDKSDFIRISLGNIQKTLGEATILVLLIIFLFLRNLRAAIIPMVTIPISLIGVFTLLNLCGFSINSITLLAMVLAIGLVVDDAIVVLENIHRHIEKGIPALKAAQLGASEIGFAIIAMTCTLASVYTPIAFIQGSLGRIFIEFAVTLAGTVLISGVVALTLSPLMCARVLRGKASHDLPQVDKGFIVLSTTYRRYLSCLQNRTKIIFSGCAGLLVLMVLLFRFLPHETAPKEDRGLVGAFIPTIPGKHIEAQNEAIIDVENRLKDLPENASYFTFSGDWGSNYLCTLKDWSQRKRSAEQLVEAMRKRVENIPSIDVWPWSWDTSLPGCDEGSDTATVKLAVMTLGTYRQLYQALESFREKIEETKLFQDVSHSLKIDSPGYHVHMDRQIMAQVHITPQQVSQTLEVFLNGINVEETFRKDDIRYPILVKGSSSPWTLSELYLTNLKNKRISLAALASLEQTATPNRLDHHSQLRAGYLSISPHPHQTVAQVMNKVTTLKKQFLPQDILTTWVGSAKAYLESSSQMYWLLIMALVFIYGILAVQFESFLDPLIIIFTVPLGCTGALLGLWITGYSLNIYTQIGLVTLIGLITKHGILIVEFANQFMKEGASAFEAAYQSAQVRLRPILMTTAAMIFGAIPLVLASGAGAESRRCIGLVLVFGLAIGTFLTLFIIPTVYGFIKDAQSVKKSIV